MSVDFSVDGSVCTITLNRPEALNAFDRKQINAFSEACFRFRDDEALSVAIITGAGDRAFSAGADIKDLLPALTDHPAEQDSYMLPPTIMAGLTIFKPMIAAVNGFAFGGGMECAMACDLRIASTQAKFGQPEIALGLIPGWGGTQRLPRLVNGAAAMEMLLTGDSIDAETAYRIGLVNVVVPPPDLLATAYEYAERIMKNAPLAIRAAKEAVMRGMETSLDDGIRIEKLLVDQLSYSEDLSEGLAAFREKRRPSFRGV
jgi:enoyl-CoA hydratase/carnithine racemase